jgi:hypothetical protein
MYMRSRFFGIVSTVWAIAQIYCLAWRIISGFILIIVVRVYTVWVYIELPTFRRYVFPPNNRSTMSYVYRVSQEERSIFWEVIVSVILSKNLYMYMCHVPNGFRDRAISLCSALCRRATRHVLRRVAKCIEVDGGIFENVLYWVKLYQLCHLNNKYRY